ncbi:MAG: hypothetical protein BGO78_10910 [Chloroflexi bacterium 44-23]|nr:MAG: hypothetical protein BGO78_10910 [Chloroflexi bacterium 44-23]
MQQKLILKLKNIRAVLWDLDGTLLDTVDLHWQAWQRILSEHHIPLTHETFLPTFGLRNDAFIPMFLGKQVSSAEIERIGDDKERIFRELLHLSPLELMPGVMQLLDIFQHQGWQQAIATMTPYENLAAILEKLPIHSYFDVLVTGEQVQKGKPAPDIFLLAAEQLGVEAQQCMVIEDTPMGIEAAQAGGMLAVGIGAAFAAGCGDLFMPNLEAVAEVFQGLLN